MKIFKKIILAVLMLAMVLSLASCAGTSTTAKVDDASGVYGNLTWTYTKDDKTLAIHGTGEMPNAAKAADVAWNAVRLGVEKVTVDSSITTIGNYAFYGMRNVKNIEVHAGVTAIGDGAFAFCVALESISLPEGVKTVGASAFEGCSELLVAQLPSTVTSVGERAFAFCGKLESVQILGAIDGIKDRTFWSCYSLNELKLNPEVKDAAENSFDDCKISYANAEFTTEMGTKVTLTIKYVDINGNTMAPDKVLVLEVGEHYSEVSPSFEAFDADKFTVSGTAGDKDETVIVTYAAKAVDSESESETEPKEQDEFGVMDAVAICIFVVVIAGIVVAVVMVMRADKKNAAKNQKGGKSNKTNKK